MNQDRKDFTQLDNLMFGLTLIGAGIIFFMDQIHLIRARDYWYLIPIVIALSGVIKAVAFRTGKAIGNGLLQAIFATWIYVSIEHIWGMNFYNSWPLLIIGFGVQYLAAGLFAEKN